MVVPTSTIVISADLSELSQNASVTVAAATQVQVVSTAILTGPVSTVPGPPGTTDYLALTNKPTIPTANSQLTNDSGYTTTTALTTGLATKANTTHTHAEADITGLPADLAGKQNTLVSGTTIKTINSTSLLGSGDIVISGGTSSDATAVAKGIVQLAGDLGGTAAAPTVPGLAGKQATLVSATNIKTINGSTLLGSGDLVVTGTGGTTNLSQTLTSTTVGINSDTGTDIVIAAADATNAGVMTVADRTKLTGIATGATANSADATLLARANHTGTQLAATVSDFSTAADARITAATATGTGSLVRATSPVLVTPALGTPASGVATNLTGTAAGLTAGNATKLATTRAINGVNFDGSAAITVPAAGSTLTDTVPIVNGGTAATTAAAAQINLNVTAADGWMAANETWTYVSATSFTVTGNVMAKYQVGDRIKLTQTTVKYFYIASLSFSVNTTINITGGDDYSLANAAITLPSYSKAQNPQSFPDWFNFTPTNVAWNGTAPSGTVTNTSKFRMDARQVFFKVKRQYSIAGSGNSQANFDIPLVTAIGAGEYNGVANGLVSTAATSSVPTDSCRAVAYGTVPTIYMFFNSITAMSFWVAGFYEI